MAYDEQYEKMGKILGDKLAQYVMSEIKSYGLDFDFIPPKTNVYLGGIISTILYGKKIPDDVTEDDDIVLERFLEKCIDDFLNIYADDDIKDFVKTYSIRNQASRFDYETSRTSWNPPKEAKNAFLITLGVWR